jgi:hypothetical protein
VGSVVLSVDAELAWGFVDRDSPPVARVESGRDGWRTLRRLCEEYDVPATWAVVAHLLHEDCDGAHADHPIGPGWFARERGEWADRPDLTRAPELVERLRESPIDHDIGCHAYGHVEFGEPGTTRAMAAAELAYSRTLMDEWGIDGRSFVFPRNNVGHVDLLADYGFEVYRGRRPVARRSLPEKLKTVAVGDGRPPLVRPTVDDGLVNLPASLFLYSFEGAPLRATKPLLGDPVVELVERGLDAAADEEGVLHLWLHPNNLVDDAAVERIEAVLRAVDDRRDAVPVETMASVAARRRPKRVR